MREYDLGTFSEGPYTMDVSGTTELISLTAGFESYEFGNRTKLKVKVKSPGSGEYFIKAEELTVENFYWFQTKPMSTSAGEKVFSGWEVDRWLRRTSTTKRNLGVLAFYGSKNSREFLPTWVYHTNSPSSARYYIAQVRLGMNVARGNWKVYQGKSKAVTRMVHEGRILEQYGGSCIPLRISTAKLPLKGWYTVEVNLFEKGTLDARQYSFYFYHE